MPPTKVTRTRFPTPDSFSMTTVLRRAGYRVPTSILLREGRYGEAVDQATREQDHETLVYLRRLVEIG